MQVYEGLGTITGAATPEEQARLEHRLIGFVPVTQPFSVGEYMPLAHAAIDDALAGGRRPIVVGGTGLYLRASLTDLNLRPPPDPELRARIAKRMDDEGPDALLAEVLEREPSAQIARGDRNRIIRYLELLEMREGGEPELTVTPNRGPGPSTTAVSADDGLTTTVEGPGPPERGSSGARGASGAAGESQLWTSATRHPTLLVGLVMDRDELDRRIDTRMEAIAAAAIDEVRAADAAGASETARKAHGFEDLLRGDVEAMKLKARQFARRQLTWMRKMAGVRIVDATGRDPMDVAREILGLLA